jgi:hypothetical protein
MDTPKTGWYTYCTLCHNTLRFLVIYLRVADFLDQPKITSPMAEDTMAKILISICLSLFFFGVVRLFTPDLVVAILVGLFVLFFSFFGLSLVAAARFSDDC